MRTKIRVRALDLDSLFCDGVARLFETYQVDVDGNVEQEAKRLFDRCKNAPAVFFIFIGDDRVCCAGCGKVITREEPWRNQFEYTSVAKQFCSDDCKDVDHSDEMIEFAASLADSMNQYFYTDDSK